MDRYDFTEHVRTALAAVRKEASRLGHEYVGTEHMLLGLIRAGDGLGECRPEPVVPAELLHADAGQLPRGLKILSPCDWQRRLKTALQKIIRLSACASALSKTSRDTN